MKNVLQKPWIWIVFWAFFCGLLLFNFSFSLEIFLRELTVFLLFSHVLFGGYFVFQKSQITNIFLIPFLVIIIGFLVFSIVSIPNILNFLIGLSVLFAIIFLFYLCITPKIQEIYLQEICHYKMYIETIGFLLSIFGIFLWYMGVSTLFLSVSGLFFTILLNIFIFQKKKLYHVSYPNFQHKPEKLSIIIIAYNEEKYIGKLLQSLVPQKEKIFEILVVNDQSEDLTKEEVQKFSQILPISILEKTMGKRGPSSSRNFGAKHAQGDTLIFFDADVIVPENFLEKIVHEFFSQQLSMATFDFKPLTKNTFDQIYTKLYRIWIKTVQFYEPRGAGFGLMTTKKFHEKILFDETVVMAEDFDYVKRASFQGKFRVISGCPVLASWRRFEHENRFLLLLKYGAFELYRQMFGEIRKNFLKYEFGKYEK